MGRKDQELSSWEAPSQTVLQSTHVTSRRHAAMNSELRQRGKGKGHRLIDHAGKRGVSGVAMKLKDRENPREGIVKRV